MKNKIQEIWNITQKTTAQKHSYLFDKTSVLLYMRKKSHDFRFFFPIVGWIFCLPFVSRFERLLRFLRLLFFPSKKREVSQAEKKPSWLAGRKYYNSTRLLATLSQRHQSRKSTRRKFRGHKKRTFFSYK